MDFEQFENLLADVRGGSSVTGLPPEIQVFDFLPASEEDLARVESELGVALPAIYRQFMTRYGGGEFLFLDLLPALMADGEDLLTVNMSEGRRIRDFVAVAPVGTGDWWGFQCSDGESAEAVSFWFLDDDRFEFANADFLEFLVEKGLRLTLGG